MKFRDYAGYAALVCAWLSAGNLTGATFEESGLVELSPEERASLRAPAPLWADEIDDNEGPIVLRDDVVIPVAGNGPQAAGFAGTKWTGGNVYYQFNANVNGTNKSRFRAAATEWAANAIASAPPRSPWRMFLIEWLSAATVSPTAASRTEASGLSRVSAAIALRRFSMPTTCRLKTHLSI